MISVITMRPFPCFSDQQNVDRRHPLIFNIKFASAARTASFQVFDSNRQIAAYSDLRLKGRLKDSSARGGGGVWEEAADGGGLG